MKNKIVSWLLRNSHWYCEGYDTWFPLFYVSCKDVRDCDCPEDCNIRKLLISDDCSND